MKVGTDRKGSSVPMEGRNRRRGFKCAYSCSGQSRHSRLTATTATQTSSAVLLSMGLTTQVRLLKEVKWKLQNSQFIYLKKMCLVLSSVIKSHTTLLCPA